MNAEWISDTIPVIVNINVAFCMRPAAFLPSDLASPGLLYLVARNMT